MYVCAVDEIYHLASPASPVKYMYNPIKTIKTNALGTLNMLGNLHIIYSTMRLVSTSNVLYYCGSVCSGLAKRVKGKILLSSTSEVYGDPEARFETMYNVLLTCVCVCVCVCVCRFTLKWRNIGGTLTPLVPEPATTRGKE